MTILKSKSSVAILCWILLRWSRFIGQVEGRNKVYSSV